MTIEKVAEKMSHAVATCFQLKERGFIREGYFADLVVVDMYQPDNGVANPIFLQMRLEPVGRFIHFLHRLRILL